jgi:hypothetical protein
VVCVELQERVADAQRHTIVVDKHDLDTIHQTILAAPHGARNDGYEDGSGPLWPDFGSGLVPA